jgi:xylulose-5-phosphate/fructose-6-phosphate phosphoketolase
VLNNIDRFHLAMDVIDRVPRLQESGAHLRQHLSDKLAEHHQYVRIHGTDMPEVADWRWKAA